MRGEDYKIFKMSCHYELGGTIKEDDIVFIEEFCSCSEREAYKYFTQHYNKNSEQPSYYILAKSDYSWFEHIGKKELYSDCTYSGLE